MTKKSKARLIVRGFQQVQGEDFNKTYASDVEFTSVWAVFALFVCLDLDLSQMDVVTAFLIGDLDEDIFMKILPGVIWDMS